MARYTGKDCDVTVGGNAVSAVKEVNVDEEAETFEAVAFGDTAASQDVGIVKNSGSIVVYDDPADSSGQGALTPGASVSLVVYPEGNSTGKVSRTFTAIVSRRSQPVRREYVERTYQFVIDGAITDGTVA